MLLQAFGTLLYSTEAPEGSAAALPYISQLLEAAGRCSHPWSQVVSALAGGKSIVVSVSFWPSCLALTFAVLFSVSFGTLEELLFGKKKKMKIATRLRYARIWYVDLDFEKFLNQSYTRI